MFFATLGSPLSPPRRKLISWYWFLNFIETGIKRCTCQETSTRLLLINQISLFLYLNTRIDKRRGDVCNGRNQRGIIVSSRGRRVWHTCLCIVIIVGVLWFSLWFAIYGSYLRSFITCDGQRVYLEGKMTFAYMRIWLERIGFDQGILGVHITCGEKPTIQVLIFLNYKSLLFNLCSMCADVLLL